MDTTEHATRKKVRQPPTALRQQVLTECPQPGASEARVAQAIGIKANIVHAWRRQDRRTSPLRDAGAPAPATEVALREIGVIAGRGPTPAPDCAKSPRRLPARRRRRSASSCVRRDAPNHADESPSISVSCSRIAFTNWVSSPIRALSAAFVSSPDVACC